MMKNKHGVKSDVEYFKNDVKSNNKREFVEAGIKLNETNYNLLVSFYDRAPRAIILNEFLTATTTKVTRSNRRSSIFLFKYF